MNRLFFSILIMCSCFAFTLHAAEEATASTLSLNPIFSSHMVLQRDQEIRIWGTATPAALISVQFAGGHFEGTADEDGKWSAHFAALKAGGPYSLQVGSGKEKLELKNILMGDVWLCSGQSNMGWTVKSSNDANKEIAAADWPQVRLFTVRRSTKQQLQDTVVGTWEICSPKTVPYFSAVGYFFGRHIHQTQEVPVGLINSSWGGTPAEAWTTYGTLKKNPELSPITDRFEKGLVNYEERAKSYIAEKKKWDAAKKLAGKSNKDNHSDPGNKGYALGYAQADADLSEWEKAKVPGAWTMNIDGAVWYRRTLEVPESFAGKEVTLHLGAIDDFDVTYFNNKEVGKTGKGTANFWTHQRVYTIPNAQTGSNTLAVRVFDHYGAGGMMGPAKEMYLVCEDQRINLAGQWVYKVELELNPLALRNPPRPRAPMGPDHSHAPAGLYNAMIHPLMPLAIKGAIWYQGETNGGRGYQYRTLLPAMIKDWRDGFQSGQFPFLTVQLANYQKASEIPSAGGWAELREAQLLTTLNDKNNGQAIIIDIGEANDIHPKNKQDVGKRLGLAAQKIAYSQDIVHSGPTYIRQEIVAQSIRLHFTDIGSGLLAKGGPLKRFSIAGADQVFQWAEAVIDGDTIVVSCASIAEPKAVRYAWSTNPAGCNLYNKEGLPASPFRTDDWPLQSLNRK